jgi:hygromycin-B 4-O-kinase
VLQHGDLRLKNVVTDEDGEHIAALIDWETCLSAPGPYWDLSLALHDLGVDEKEVFLDGYGMTPAEFTKGARFVRALNLLNYAWAIGEAKRDRRRVAWLKARLKGTFDIAAS